MSRVHRGTCPGLSAVQASEPWVDILSFHPYYVWNGKAAQMQVTKKEGFIKLIEDTVAFADRVGKGLIASETVWGARDDAKHVEVMRFTLDGGEHRPHRRIDPRTATPATVLSSSSAPCG